MDAGHGGSDPGASSENVYEKDITLQTALKMQWVLEGRGYTVYMSRTTDVYPSLSDRTNGANSAGVDLFIRFRCIVFAKLLPYSIKIHKNHKVSNNNDPNR